MDSFLNFADNSKRSSSLISVSSAVKSIVSKVYYVIVNRGWLLHGASASALVMVTTLSPPSPCPLQQPPESEPGDQATMRPLSLIAALAVNSTSNPLSGSCHDVKMVWYNNNRAKIVIRMWVVKQSLNELFPSTQHRNWGSHLPCCIARLFSLHQSPPCPHSCHIITTSLPTLDMNYKHWWPEARVGLQSVTGISS